jgi:hypothetical protein
VNASSAVKKKWFPPSSLAEFILLCILVGLLLAFWLQAKRDLSGPSEPVLLTMHPTTPRAAIYSENGLRVVDCVSGKTLLKLRTIAHHKEHHSTEDSPWHVWPGSGADFAWTRQLLSVIATVDTSSGFKTRIEEEPIWDQYGVERTGGVTLKVVASLPNGGQPVDDGPLRLTFSESGGAIIILARAASKKFECRVIDLQSGKKTIYTNSANPTGLAARMGSVGDLIIFGTPDRQIDKLIDPAAGFVDPKAFPHARAALDRSKYDSPQLPIHAIDDQGRKILLTLLPKNGFSLVAEPDLESREFTDHQAAKVLESWNTELNRSWQSKDRLVLWGPPGTLPGQESNIWLVTSQAPLLRRAPWPFSPREQVTQLTMQSDVRGIIANRAHQNDATSQRKSEFIYWDFENGRVVTIPDDSIRARHYGDFIVAQTDSLLQTIDLNSGKVLQTISLRQGIRPPLTLAWIIWLGVWCFAKRKAETKDLTRSVGAITAMFFALLIALSYYYDEPSLAWLLNLLLIASLLLSLCIIAVMRRASLISLTICGLLALGFLFSGIQRGFANSPDDGFGPFPSAAKRLADSLSQTTLGNPQQTLNSLKSPWITPQKTPLPAPQVTIDPP